MKKLFILSCVALSLVAASASASATTVTKDSGGQSFTNSWELVTSGSGWIMEYGYNKFAIDEDYVHTKHTSTGHTAILKNATRQFSNSASADSWANVDVQHNGTYITYSIVY